MTTLETLPLKEKTELKPSSTNNLEVYQCFWSNLEGHCSR
jgi:hypothetical protein